MGLFSFLQGSSTSDSERTGAADPVQTARSRARRRLIGAAVLLGVGVIGFPLLFETQPRPIPVDIPIEIPRKEGAPSLPLPPPRTASAAPAVARVSSGVATSESTRSAPDSAVAAATPRTEAPATRSDSTPAARPTAPAKAETQSEPKAEAKSEPKVEPKAEAKSGTRSDDGARARSLLEGQAATPNAAANKPATATGAEPTKAADAGAGRFVVQVGAYGEASSARDMRQRVDKLGLKSYSQVTEVDGAKRIRVRVGPFGSREDAEKAAGTLKAAGLPAAILTL
jgi:DedD protein